MSYYDRPGAPAPDKQPVFRTVEDQRAEAEVAAELAIAWDCKVWPYAPLSSIDWWLERGERFAGMAELKSRNTTITTYPTVYLNQRKYHTLLNASTAHGVPGIFVVKFLDDIRWIDIYDIDAREVIIGGCNKMVKARSDYREPIIEVPVCQMKGLRPPYDWPLPKSLVLDESVMTHMLADLDQIVTEMQMNPTDRPFEDWLVMLRAAVDGEDYKR